MDGESFDPDDGGGPDCASDAACASDDGLHFVQNAGSDAVQLGEPFCAESVADLLDDASMSAEVLHGPPTTILDVLTSPDDFAKHFATIDPDPADLSLLSALDPWGLSPAGRIDLLIALRRHTAALNAASTEGVAVVSQRVTDGGLSLELGHECANAEISTALMISPRVAAFELSHATQLVSKLPAAMDLLKRGVITDGHTSVLARETVGVSDPAVLAAIEASVLTRAVDQTPQLFARSVKRAVLRHDQVSAERQHREALAKRTVEHTSRPDGMAEIWALLPAEDAAAVMTTVRALAARTCREDTRSADQRRADAFTAVFADTLTSGRVPTQHGTRPTVQVTVALTTLAGADDLPGELEGHGPVPAAVARRIAADPTGTWRRLVTDSVTGELLDYGRTKYTPPQDLADYVIARDQVCSFPTCAVSAKLADLDHRVPFPEGATDKVNLDPKCRCHHRLKHETGWTTTAVRDATGTTYYEWTSPTGHTYRNHTPPLADAENNQLVKGESADGEVHNPNGEVQIGGSAHCDPANGDPANGDLPARAQHPELGSQRDAGPPLDGPTADGPTIDDDPPPF
ncbi:uncharacterized protein DUF222 [Jatrophihabitans sp. GAS493]|uniref:HNH endonuclease signature motif containing protein n=1 Tax=Jatrophihabitans sp. GAS493 TaxID=1907575 RepID=UPI000BB833E8|nr:HNH endonuclease signature motif containing protein [Jatrophihabitans sp. GAS493]SOD74481.1 uncharacterized protein DUF222 [Jatrophihabitans sp. GAS493]